jgi:hypothetical protein
MKNYIILILSAFLLLSCENDSESGGEMQGQGGSLARFALSKGNLYVVDHTSINVFEIQVDGSVVEVNKIEAGFGIETIFANDDYLYLGSQQATYIYGLDQPSSPEYIASYLHVTSCDPVVVNGSYAYVTLRIDNCRATGFNALEILDVSDVRNPFLVKSYQVESPYGLGVDRNTLFLCQGTSGLKIFDVSDPLNISTIKHYPSIHAYDVIPRNNTLLVTGNDGIFQYDYTDLTNIKELSHIPVE